MSEEHSEGIGSTPRDIRDRPFKLSLWLVPVLRWGNKSEIGVDGHDVLLIPHSPNAPPTPRGGRGAGRGVGHVGLGGWGGALGGGGD